MNLIFKPLVCLAVVATVVLAPGITNRATAQFMEVGQVFDPDFQNTVDFDLARVVNCDIFDPTDPDPLAQFVCEQLLPFLVDQLLEAEAFCDEVFVGYRNDMPRILRNQLVDPVIIFVSIEEIDGAGGVLARAGPIQGLDTNNDGNIDLPGILSVVPPQFLRARRFRAWSIPRFATMELDLDDIPDLIFTEGMVATAIHEAFHALGHPVTFEISGLNQSATLFSAPDFVGDRFGVGGRGFGIREYRIESENPLATFIPLSQADGSAHLSTFEEAFFNFEEATQEVFLPVAAPPGIAEIMSRSLRGMFADMGYRIRGINAPGVIDIDGDAEDDVPLRVNPDAPGF